MAFVYKAERKMTYLNSDTAYSENIGPGTYAKDITN